jgi:hypothetical protein
VRFLSKIEHSPKLAILEVKNFGPIRSARINFESVTVLTGPYNVGKTYLATLAYVLAGADFDTIFDPVPILIKHKIYGNFTREKVMEVFAPFLSEAVAEAKSKLSSLFTKAFPKVLCEKLVLSSPSELVMKGADEAYIKAVWKEKIDSSERLLLKLEIKFSQSGEQVFLKSCNVTKQAILSNLARIRSLTIDEKMSSLGYTRRFLGDPLYIPAERLFALSNIHSLLQLLIETHGARALGYEVARRSAIQRVRGTMRPLLLDYLTYLMGIFKSGSLFDKTSALPSNPTITLADIEDLIGGQATLDKDTLTVFYKNKNGSRVPIAGASSGVAQLIAMMLYLPADPKRVKGFSFIVVEEPEINLHANHQLKVASLIAKISRLTDVVITTHSEYILEKLAHLWAQGEIKSLGIYFIDPETHRTKKILAKKETGEIELLKTIDEAVEALAGEGLRLMEKPKNEEHTV